MFCIRFVVNSSWWTLESLMLWLCDTFLLFLWDIVHGRWKPSPNLILWLLLCNLGLPSYGRTAWASISTWKTFYTRIMVLLSGRLNRFLFLMAFICISYSIVISLYICCSQWCQCKRFPLLQRRPQLRV